MEPVKKNRAIDIILVLRAPDGKPLNSAGTLDKRLFDGGNRLHAFQDTQTSLWSLKYDHGIIPEPLKQRFTNLNNLLKFTTDYLKKRNIEIVEVID